MPVATITVAFVNPPKGTAKSGSIKSEAGDYYRVWFDKLAQFSQGWTGTIEYTDENWNGKDYRQFKRIVGENKQNGAGQSVPVSGRGPTQTPPSSDKSTEMFIMAMMGKAWEGTGGLPEREACRQHILDLRWAWESAWRTTLPIGQSVAPPELDLNDEIPF